MISVLSFLMILGGVLIPALVIISMGMLLIGRRRGKEQRRLHPLADPTQYPWNIGRGSWFLGNWGINDKINAAISEGRRRQRYARETQHRRAKGRK